MGTTVAYLIGFFVGRLVASMAYLSLALIFVKQKDNRNIILTAFVTWMISALLNFIGSLDGYPISLHAFIWLYGYCLVTGILPYVLITSLVIWCHWTDRKWFAKGMAWFGGILLGFILLVGVPVTIYEQYHLFDNAIVVNNDTQKTVLQNQNTQAETVTSERMDYTLLTMAQWKNLSSEQQVQAVREITDNKIPALSFMTCLNEIKAEPKYDSLPIRNAIDVCKMVIEERKHQFNMYMNDKNQDIRKDNE